MLDKDNSQVNISIRKTEELESILDYLKEKLLLNTTSVITLSLVKLYEIEKENEHEGGR